ncbi:DUF1573 domain-containing protein [bacterium]|nr:DUF1573 domain-containing protein [bacterium]
MRTKKVMFLRKQLEQLVVCSTRLLFLVVTLLFALSAWATPKLSLESPIYEFGVVPQGRTVSHSFRFRNVGTSPLEIQRVVPACGCTVSKLEKELLEPGEEANLAVELDTKGISGSKVKTVRMYTNDPDQLTALLTLQGEVQPEVLVTPTRIQFGEVVRRELEQKSFSKENTVERSFSVKLRDGSRGKITGLTSRSKWIEVETLSSDARSLQAVARLRRDVLEGEFRDRIVISLSGTKQRTVNIPLYASVRSQIELKPEVVSFGIVKGEGAQTQEVRIQTRGKGDFEVLSVDSDSPAVSVDIAPGVQAGVFILDVTLDETKVEKDLKTAVRIRIEERGEEREEELLLSVTAVLPPDFLRRKKGKRS